MNDNDSISKFIQDRLNEYGQVPTYKEVVDFALIEARQEINNLMNEMIQVKHLARYDSEKIREHDHTIMNMDKELELLRKVIQLQSEALEEIAAIKTLGDINLYVFYKELDKQDLEEMCLDDTELARQTLKEVDELLKGER